MQQIEKFAFQDTFLGIVYGSFALAFIWFAGAIALKIFSLV